MTHPGGLQRAFVITDDGDILVQIPDDDSRWGFYLCDDDQSWDGGTGLGNIGWEIIEDNDPRISDEDHERLDWLLENDS